MKSSKITLITFILVGSFFWFLQLNLVWGIENKSRVISPYWQSDSGSHTFLVVSHSGLNTIASQVGLAISVIQNDDTEFGAAVTFTISAGSTERIFIVRTNHSTLSATSIPTAKFLVGTTNFKHGRIRIDPVATNPTIVTPTGGRRDITMLNFWGAVVIESNTTGFAMEFIGDMHDSAATPNMASSATVSGVN